MRPTGVELHKIIDALSIFQDACEKRGVKFNKYTDAELLEILHLYKRYRVENKPNF